MQAYLSFYNANIFKLQSYKGNNSNDQATHLLENNFFGDFWRICAKHTV